MDLVYLAIIWTGVLCASWLVDKTKLTSTLYSLAFGSVFVNYGILPAETSPFLEVFSEIGIIFIMFALGFEENTNNIVSSTKRSWGLAYYGLAENRRIAPLSRSYRNNDFCGAG